MRKNPGTQEVDVFSRSARDSGFLPPAGLFRASFQRVSILTFKRSFGRETNLFRLPFLDRTEAFASSELPLLGRSLCASRFLCFLSIWLATSSSNSTQSAVAGVDVVKTEHP